MGEGRRWGRGEGGDGDTQAERTRAEGALRKEPAGWEPAQVGAERGAPSSCLALPLCLFSWALAATSFSPCVQACVCVCVERDGQIETERGRDRMKMKQSKRPRASGSVI